MNCLVELKDRSSKPTVQGVRRRRCAQEARDYIVNVARGCGAKRVVKGKSMTTEEIDLNPALTQRRNRAVETDLGEYIVQLRNERPSHIITPAIHLSKEDIGGLFTDKLDIPYTAEPEQLTAVARDRLRKIFLTAEMGITGVNFAIAETGTLVLVENEGNGRLSSTMPEVFVAVMGIEKVIPRLSDLQPFSRGAGADRDRPEAHLLYQLYQRAAPQGRNRRAARDARRDAGQRPQRDAGRSGPARGALLPALRRVP